ncbi:hypothetical protein PIB30_007931 [Stylosanthes scabra]|uniref:Uncharacterized protein n=1 Tax=Stylosanthes scabra TaxID=79078 RepID=A0ABU6S4F3_9FABA|nr:hypothetical protein [Stylosanthes scabra]
MHFTQCQPTHGLQTYGAAGSHGNGEASRKLAQIGDTTTEVRSTGGQRREPRLVTQPVHVLDKGMTFPPMNYRYEEAQAITFIFGESLFQNAVLFKNCDKTLDKEDFLSFHLGNVPSNLFLDLIAQKTTWKQKQATRTCVWSHPLRFSELCLSPDFEASHVVDHYKDSWLPTPIALRHISTDPCAAKGGLTSWEGGSPNLMMVDISRNKIWLFDCYPIVVTVQGRINSTRKVANVLDFALRVTYNNVYIFSPFLQNNIDALSDKIRIDIALAFCDHDFNENRNHFKQRAMEDWNGKRTCHAVFGD